MCFKNLYFVLYDMSFKKNIGMKKLLLLLITSLIFSFWFWAYVLTPQDDDDVQKRVKIHRENINAWKEDKDKLINYLISLSKKWSSEKSRARNLAVATKLRWVTDEYITALKWLNFSIPQKMYHEWKFIWTIDPYWKTPNNSRSFSCNQLLWSHCINLIFDEKWIFYTNVHSLAKWSGKKPKNANPTEFFWPKKKWAVVMIWTPMAIRWWVLFSYAWDYSSANEKVSVINRMYYDFSKRRWLFGKVLEKSTIKPKNSTISIDECYSDEWMEILNIKNCNRKTVTSYVYYLHPHPVQDQVIPQDLIKYNWSDIKKAFNSAVK